MHMTVERVSYLHENEIMELIDNIKHALRPSEPEEAFEVRQAVTYVRGGNVHSFSYDASGRVVSAEIGNDDITEAEVTLSFDRLDADCTCNKTDWCAHRAAAVFHLYLQFHSLTDWMHEWRRTETDQMAFKISDRTPEAWNNVLARSMNPIRVIALRENPAVFIHKFSLIEQDLAPLYPYEWEWKPFFDIYIRLHALEAAWPYVSFHLGEESSTFSHGKWYVKNWLSDQLGKLKDNIHSIASKPRLFETDPFHENLQRKVRTFALEQSGLFYKRFQTYQLFWQYLFTNQSLRERERALLDTEYASSASIFIAFFHVLQDQEEDLKKLTYDVKQENFSEWLALAELADQHEKTDALSLIMHVLLPLMEDYLTNRVPLPRRPAFVRKIDGLLETADFPEQQREQMFSYYGESGIDVYADFLVERERFSEWAALMHRYRVPYDVTEAGGLNVALAADPASVLPLLHLYATHFIKERNRQSYRRAVRLFKKMKMSAKKSGKHEFWNRYVETVREKNRRLRALIEEMEKGNLYL